MYCLFFRTRELSRCYDFDFLLPALVATATALTLLGCASPHSVSPDNVDLKIVSFSKGKMRRESTGWTIYDSGADLTYTANGRCVFNQRRIPCMWHGFVLKYDSYGRDVELTCSLINDHPSNYGNPNEIKSEEVTAYEYTLYLSGEKNVHIQPQYSSAGTPGSVSNENTVCSLDGVPVLKFSETLRHPVATNEK